MIIDTPIWRNADLIRIIPITRADLNQAISRNDFRPENTPKPGKARWYSWRDVVSVAAAQDLRKLGFGPSMAFGLVKNHLSPFLRGSIDAPDDCAGGVSTDLRWKGAGNTSHHERNGTWNDADLFRAAVDHSGN